MPDNRTLMTACPMSSTWINLTSCLQVSQVAWSVAPAERVGPIPKLIVPVRFGWSSHKDQMGMSKMHSAIDPISRNAQPGRSMGQNSSHIGHSSAATAWVCGRVRGGRRARIRMLAKADLNQHHARTHLENMADSDE